MNYQGQITTCKENNKIKLLLDAEPHIMQRLRKIFDNAANFYERGKYTHKPIVFPNTLSACRDLIWVLDRYPLECAPDVLQAIQDKSAEYDGIVKNIANIDKNKNFLVTPDALKLALPLREHQITFLNMFKSMKRMLLGDRMGLGKTASGISILLEPEARPAIIVVPAHLCTQWEREINRFIPQATTHVIRGFKNYDLPQVDVLITSYNRIRPWQDVLLNRTFNTLIFDEVHELRHTNTAKREYAELLSEKVKWCLGMSGTPIYNYGSEIWSVLDVIKPEALGSYEEFASEWCDWGGRVHEPATLNNFLKSQGLMLRRTPEETGMHFGTASKQVYTIDADLKQLEAVQNVAKMLALSVLSGNVGEDSQSAREFDWKLRHATGVAKARPVAEFVKMLVEQGEKVLLVGWHRECYEIWNKELANLNPVMFTGSETIKEKDAAVKRFIEGDAQVFIISLRSGSGLDGLQRAANVVVFGELDWSPHVMDQVVARLDRDGQTKHVQAYYLTIADGADPFMIGVLGDKRSQHDGLVEGKSAEASILETSSAGKDRIRDMATAYLQSIGEEIPEVVPETGLLGDITGVLRRLKLPTNTEEEMQEALDKALRAHLDESICVEREFKITKKSRVDFMLQKNEEKVAIECKIESTGRAEVYRQVRRYVKESGISALVLLAPWNGIPAFKVDGTPVIVIDTNVNAI